ncbi:DgyrCDS5265 [Dimorphilus gyrociliatus]|uniref:DgyrCDS5265 n=1 Tax=Dimorphilus gyrociliatus TaxID=2664684 RepID=A0A7I8VJD1_9ANNE|nr:DgyrCDS5265 [Dimorphilus gyrociliatus]
MRVSYAAIDNILLHFKCSTSIFISNAISDCKLNDVFCGYSFKNDILSPFQWEINRNLKDNLYQFNLNGYSKLDDEALLIIPKLKTTKANRLCLSYKLDSNMEFEWNVVAISLKSKSKSVLKSHVMDRFHRNTWITYINDKAEMVLRKK